LTRNNQKARVDNPANQLKFGGNTMKKVAFVVLAVVLMFGGVLYSGRLSPAQADSPTILQFKSMVGVPPGLTGAASQAALRGISGGGLPWMLTSATGLLKSTGVLKIEVEGLVLAAGANAGSNPISSFRALVSCVNSDGSFTNILTDAFPATTGPALNGGGNADIETTVSLPHPCIAPLLFVTSPGGSWFAATGK
jgi:hypothetical protein